jgi:hypothetical protein
LLGLPIINLFDRQTRAVGSIQFIEGNSFGDTQLTSLVSLNGTPAPISSWSNNQIGIRIPQGTSLGTATVQVTTSLGSSNTLTFSVVAAPVFTALTPTSGPVGTQVTITGTGFGGATGEDNFVTIGAGGPPLPVTSWSDTQVVVTIPDYGLTLGSYPLTLRSNGVAAASTPDFTIGDPGSGPLLQLSTSDTPLQVNLSSAQVLDWIHWGRISATVPDRKDGITPLISDYTAFNSAQPTTSFGNIAFSWTDGNHPALVSESTEDIETFSTSSGFQITVPADTTPKTLNLYAEIFFGQGLLHASLSDGSAVDITDQSVTDSDIGNKVYSIDFRAASAGQTLTVTFSGTASSGGVGLQAATLTTHLPVLAITSPSAAQAFSSPATVSASASANQFINAITDIKITGSDGAVLEGSTSPFSGSLGPLTGGHYTATASATDSCGLTNSSSPIEFDVIGQGGSLSVQKGDVAPTSFSVPIDLDSQGTADWILWGPFDNGDQIIDNPEFVLARKAGVAPLISNYKPFGNHPIRSWVFANNLYFGDGNQVFFGGSELLIRGLNNGYEISVAADSTQRTLQLYVGAISARGKLTAFLSDGSAAVVTDNSFDFPSSADSNGFGGTAVYTIAYSAASTGQTLTLRYTLDFDYGLGEVDLIGAALSGNPVAPAVPAPQIASITPGTSLTNTKVTIAGANFGASQGSGGVYFGELNGQVMTWTDTSIDVMVPAALFDGSTTQVVVSTANGTSNSVSFHVPAYQVFPRSLSILVGQSQTVTVKDANHNIISGLSWSTSNPSIVSLSTADPAVITGLFPGTATVYAGDVPFQVTVYTGTSLPPGTVLWSTPPGPGATSFRSMVPAVPSSSGVDLLAYDDAGFLSAFSADGELLGRQWVFSVKQIIPDFSGNTLVNRLETVISPADGTWHEHHKISRVDLNTGNLTDFYTFADQLVGTCFVFPPGGGSYETQCFDDHRTFEKAIPGTSGVLFVQENNTVSVVDMSANQLLGSAQFDQNELYGQIIVAGDGNAYVTLISQDTTVTHPGDRTEAVHSVNTLELMGVSPDGTSAKTGLNSWTSDSTTTTLDTLPGFDQAHTFSAVHFTSSGIQPALGTNSIITNADNGVAVFVRIGSDAACSDGIVGTYLDADGSHTYSQGTGCGYEPERTFVAFAAKGSSGSHLEAQIKGFEPSLQREDGSFIGTARNNNLAAVALDGTVPWQRTLNPNITGVGDPITPLYATADGGAIVTSTTIDPFGVSHLGTLYTVDQNGNVAGQAADLGAVYSWTKGWYLPTYIGSAITGLSRSSLDAIGYANTFAATANGNPSHTEQAVKMELLPSFDHCTATPGCIGHFEAIYNALDDLIVRLKDPVIASLAQTQIFDKLGHDANGFRLTTQGFLTYLSSQRPEFYDAVRSTYCYSALLPPSSKNPICNNRLINLLFAERVQDYFKFHPDTSAVTGTPSYPLLVFVRPAAIGFNNLGRNLGNEGTVWHEALHGITGMDDFTLMDKLGLPPADFATCSISVRVRNAVLSHSPGIDPQIVWSCSTGD